MSLRRSLHRSRARSFSEISPLHSFLDKISDVFMRNRTGPVTEMRIIITWLAPWTGKMNQILRCDWLPELESGGILPARDYPLCPARKFLPKAINISFINQACPVKMAGYWPRSFYWASRFASVRIEEIIQINFCGVNNCLAKWRLCVPETSRKGRYWQPAPRWRPLPWLANPRNPAMSPHAEGEKKKSGTRHTDKTKRGTGEEWQPPRSPHAQEKH